MWICLCVYGYLNMGMVVCELEGVAVCECGFGYVSVCICEYGYVCLCELEDVVV